MEKLFLLENGHVFTRTVVVQLNPFERHMNQLKKTMRKI